MIYARAGERVETPDGRYLCTIARDLDSAASRWSVDDFTNCAIDLSSAAERLPVTSWLCRRLDAMHDRESAADG